MRSKSDGQGLLPQEQTIYDRLAAALHPLRVQWLADAADRHTVHFMTIHDRLPHARRRLQDIDARIGDLMSLNRGDEVTADIRRLEKLRQPFRTIANSAAASYTRVDDYLAHVAPKLASDYDALLQQAARRLHGAGVVPDGLQVVCTGSGSVILSCADGSAWHADMGWPPARSVQRSPQVRLKVQAVPDGGLRTRTAAAAVPSPSGGADGLMQAVRSLGGRPLDDWLHLHAGYYGRLQDKLPFAVQRAAELEREIELLSRMAPAHDTAARRRSLTGVLRTFRQLTDSAAARFDSRAAYLDHVRRTWDATLSQAATAFADRCRSRRFDTATLRIGGVQALERGFSFTVADAAGHSAPVSVTFTGLEGVAGPPGFRFTFGGVRQNAGLDTATAPSAQAKPVAGPVAGAPQPAGLVTAARIVEYNGQLYVTCHIAGRRQAPVRIRPDLWQAYRTQPGADKTSLAAAHFPRQIAEALKALTSGISATDLGSTLKIK